MTERELLEHICAMAKAHAIGGQPPFAEVAVPVHPDAPFDYEAVRQKAFEQVLGQSDQVFHPPLGAPHVDVHRYPPHSRRAFWCYATNGMSDFPQNFPDCTEFRSELMCCSATVDQIWPDLLRVLAMFPFRARTFLHLYHTVPFPDGIADPRFTYILTVPPFLVPDLAKLSFREQPLLVASVIRITAAERDYAVRASTQALIESLPDTLDTWLIDGRGTEEVKDLPRR